ncbi:hypothetical protein [Pseudoxanthomonas sp. PXM02]|uniref:hypothetical protein n=1 Tax=Pseudoxanthomonas sp. PXM02 TaxID=2769294 RepID=UPI0017814DAE|nr:hypothetical protein [Pseudoxanthomonas sp. PXM02]MBD9477412.1 hypothetical protein [Pseudoxanthomonas sp. PXM02]
MSDLAAVQSPIPYRAEATISSGELTSTLVATILLLAAFLALALYAKKRGWLQKLTTLGSVGQTGKRGRFQVSAQRISRMTTVYRIEDGARAWLVVESTGQIAVSAIADTEVEEGTHGAP